MLVFGGVSSILVRSSARGALRFRMQSFQSCRTALEKCRGLVGKMVTDPKFSIAPNQLDRFLMGCSSAPI